jgi:hypothetical protein
MCPGHTNSGGTATFHELNDNTPFRSDPGYMRDSPGLLRPLFPGKWIVAGGIDVCRILETKELSAQ